MWYLQSTQGLHGEVLALCAGQRLVVVGSREKGMEGGRASRGVGRRAETEGLANESTLEQPSAPKFCSGPIHKRGVQQVWVCVKPEIHWGPVFSHKIRISEVVKISNFTPSGRVLRWAPKGGSCVVPRIWFGNVLSKSHWIMQNGRKTMEWQLAQIPPNWAHTWPKRPEMFQNGPNIFKMVKDEPQSPPPHLLAYNLSVPIWKQCISTLIPPISWSALAFQNLCFCVSQHLDNFITTLQQTLLRNDQRRSNLQNVSVATGLSPSGKVAQEQGLPPLNLNP